MERNGIFYRVVFFLLACLATTSYELSLPYTSLISTTFIGLAKGTLIFLLFLGLENTLKGLSLRSFNTTMVGIAIGAVMGLIISKALDALMTQVNLKLTPDISHFLFVFVYLSSIFLGIKASHTGAEVWWMSIPFIQLSPIGQAKRRELLLDISSLEDGRLTDLARTGILDSQLVVASFILKEIQKGMESQDEVTKTRFRKCFEQLKRLENMPNLGLVHKDFHTSELDDLTTKLIKTAKLVGASIMTSEQSTVKQGDEEGVIFIAIENIANSIKPTAQRGEVLTIKIQRPGKEPKQGVGYLEDGTMVVVNGGGDFLGETIKTQVLSQKYSSSGKIIFCNAITADEKSTVARSLNQEDAIPPGVTPYTGYTSERREEVLQGPPRIKREGFNDPWHRH
jgi:uncharacterized protein YacL